MFLTRIAEKLAALSLRGKIVLSLATFVFLMELGLKRWAPKSRAYAGWKAFFEAIGSFWTAIILSLVYVLSVGPISAILAALGRDPLDRAVSGEATFWRVHEPNPLGIEAAARHQF